MFQESKHLVLVDNAYLKITNWRRESLFFVCACRSQVHEDSHLALRSDKKQIESPDVCWDTCVGSIITKHPNSTTLGKFVIFIIKVFWGIKWRKKLEIWTGTSNLPFCGLTLTISLDRTSNLIDKHGYRRLLSSVWFCQKYKKSKSCEEEEVNCNQDYYHEQGFSRVRILNASFF